MRKGLPITGRPSPCSKACELLNGTSGGDRPCTSDTSQFFVRRLQELPGPNGELATGGVKHLRTAAQKSLCRICYFPGHNVEVVGQDLRAQLINGYGSVTESQRGTDISGLSIWS